MWMDYDKDHFDDVCDHLIVEERRTGEMVGTYRMQMGDVAGQYFGYYSEQEFCFAPYEAMRGPDCGVGAGVHSSGSSVVGGAAPAYGGGLRGMRW